MPDASPVFEGHFPGHPLLPGVLMIETMAQTGGWLVLATLRFTRMPFLAQVKEAKLRGFVAPGQTLEAEARLVHDGSGYAVVTGRIELRRASKVAEAEITYRRRALPQRRRCAAQMLETARRVAVPEDVSCQMARSDADRDALITGIGLVSCLGEGPTRTGRRWTRPAASRRWWTPTRFAPWPVHPMAPLDLDRQIPKRGDQRQMEAWQRIGVYAAGLALDAAGVKGNAGLARAHGHDRRGRRRRARLCRRRGDPVGHAGSGRSGRAAERAADVRTCARRCSSRSFPTCWRATSRWCTAWSAPRAPSWARRQPAPTRCASPARGSPPGRATCSWSAARTTPSGRTSLLHYEMGGVLSAGGRFAAGLGAPGGAAAAWCWGRSAASW